MEVLEEEQRFFLTPELTLRFLSDVDVRERRTDTALTTAKWAVVEGERSLLRTAADGGSELESRFFQDGSLFAFWREKELALQMEESLRKTAGTSCLLKFPEPGGNTLSVTSEDLESRAPASSSFLSEHGQRVLYCLPGEPIKLDDDGKPKQTAVDERTARKNSTRRRLSIGRSTSSARRRSSSAAESSSVVGAVPSKADEILFAEELKRLHKDHEAAMAASAASSAVGARPPAVGATTLARRPAEGLAPIILPSRVEGCDDLRDSAEKRGGGRRGRRSDLLACEASAELKRLPVFSAYKRFLQKEGARLPQFYGAERE